MLTFKHVLIVSLVSFALAFSGCSKGGDSTVLARVNRTKITADDFKKQLEDLQPQLRQAVASDPKARREFLEDLIGIEVVLQEARRQGLDKDPEFRKRQTRFKEEMERRMREDARNELFNNLLKKELAEKLNAVTPPTDKEVRNYYNTNLDKMRTPDGKKLRFKEVEPQLKRRMMAEKQRDLYLEYAQKLREKARITVDERALDQLGTQLQQAGPDGAAPKTQHEKTEEHGKTK